MTITNIQVIISFIAMIASVVVFGQYVSNTYGNGVVDRVVAYCNNGVVAGVTNAASVGIINNFSSNCDSTVYEERGSPNRPHSHYAS